MWIESLRDYVLGEAFNLMEFSKCGVTAWSVIPTVLWGVGIAALAHRLLTKLFRRNMFRRAALWEYILQDLLYIWVVIYSIHFWVLMVKGLKLIIEFFYQDLISTPMSSGQSINDSTSSAAELLEKKDFLQQWFIWVFSLVPIVTFICTKPRQDFQPMMIWWAVGHLESFRYGCVEDDE